ncbi:nutrient deprivation-induced protein [Rhizobium sp. L1K21]|uniref:nutrient deprivation-induced protein n=1 Tax=Rhizobium sp. L1K21 TaxID=2954933 RepID=UPI002093CC4E|nr:nutrient deprivation-induced protein [Rhizobium sp. L1K21]MCO6188627.1 nutrient deprivation-induced protein [Rhizobium sp. L1K21]
MTQDTPRSAERMGDPHNSTHKEDDPSAKRQTQSLKEEIASDMETGREAVANEKDKVAGKVKHAVSENSHFAARQLGGVGEALEKAGAELEGSDQPQVGKYAREIGASVRGFAKRMENKDASEIAHIVEDFGRREPLAFLGIAAASGLAASRFLNASNRRRSGSQLTREEEADA